MTTPETKALIRILGIKKTYIFSYDNKLGTDEQIKECLDNIELILDWRKEIPNTFFLISKSNAKEISRRIREILKDGKFIVNELSKENGYGWLSSESWYLLNNKERKPREIKPIIKVKI